mmetsp:Transcript_23500/g.46183  ORF Transcript_23500/g.46183 Transcript_23500/m.46183 type:complete len:415 (-) Transcript_23500:91-1335(-)
MFCSCTSLLNFELLALRLPFPSSRMSPPPSISPFYLAVDSLRGPGRGSCRSEGGRKERRTGVGRGRGERRRRRDGRRRRRERRGRIRRSRREGRRGRRRIGGRAATRQSGHDCAVAALTCEFERRLPLAVLSVHISASVDQLTDSRGAPRVPGGGVQRGPLVRCRCVHIRASVQQQLHNIEVSTLCGHVESGMALIAPGVDQCTRFQEGLHNSEVTSVGGNPQRSGAESDRRPLLQVGTPVDDGLNGGHVAGVCGLPEAPGGRGEVKIPKVVRSVRRAGDCGGVERAAGGPRRGGRVGGRPGTSHEGPEPAAGAAGCGGRANGSRSRSRRGRWSGEVHEAPPSRASAGRSTACRRRGSEGRREGRRRSGGRGPIGVGGVDHPPARGHLTQRVSEEGRSHNDRKKYLHLLERSTG